MAQDKNEKRIPVSVEVALPTLKEKPVPETRVYLFDSAQRLVDSFDAKGKVELQVDPQQRYRVVVGPDLLPRSGKAPADLVPRLARSGAISRDLLPQAAVEKVPITVSETLFSNWLIKCINIHGKVRKLLNPTATPPVPFTYAPISMGVVQIFTIDLACSMGRLSDPSLLSLKQQVLAVLPQGSALAQGMAFLTGDGLRNYIVNNRAALAPYMCNLIPETDICYQQLPDAIIQSDGTFSLHYCSTIFDFPLDVYFEVVQTIDGTAREIADPDIMCTTMWNYDGSQGALITVTDPSAIAGQPEAKPGPGYLYVWPTAIGNIDLRQIDGLTTMAGTGKLPGGPHGTPWGGTLCLQMQFDPNLRANNIYYYRWSYKFGAFDGDPSGYTQVNASVTHRWQEITFASGIFNIHLHPYTLGPKMISGETNLFEVPPDQPGPWIDINDPADRPFAYFDSTAGQNPGASGIVTLKLEMFDNNGQHVACANDGHGGPFTFILPDPNGVPDSYTNAPAPNIDAQGNLVFEILIDNNPTTASLPGVEVTGAGFVNHADMCGMINYKAPGDIVSIDYIATHPNHFIFWNLGVTRGLSGGVASTGGDDNSAIPDSFNNKVSDLAGPCVNAAFAVNLYTYARAVDGYSRQSQYDRSATIAFALLKS